jgi:hypothetical protein
MKKEEGGKYQKIAATAANRPKAGRSVQRDFRDFIESRTR